MKKQFVSRINESKKRFKTILICVALLITVGGGFTVANAANANMWICSRQEEQLEGRGYQYCILRENEANRGIFASMRRLYCPNFDTNLEEDQERFFGRRNFNNSENRGYGVSNRRDENRRDENRRAENRRDYCPTNGTGTTENTRAGNRQNPCFAQEPGELRTQGLARERNCNTRIQGSLRQ